MSQKTTIPKEVDWEPPRRMKVPNTGHGSGTHQHLQVLAVSKASCYSCIQQTWASGVLMQMSHWRWQL
eukprot:5710720-Amphidinium_carterae.1